MIELIRQRWDYYQLILIYVLVSILGHVITFFLCFYPRENDYLQLLTLIVYTPAFIALIYKFYKLKQEVNLKLVKQIMEL